VVANQIHGNVYMGAPPQDEREALAIYRRVFVSTCRQLPLRGVDIGASDPGGQQKPLDLDQVYIALDTTTRIQEEHRPGAGKKKAQRQPGGGQGEERALSALEAVVRQRSIVLPGASWPCCATLGPLCWSRCK
jgi:hypothetical protein